MTKVCTIKKNKIEENIKKLKESPVFAMSLGERELFHSNFWAWLMKTDPMFINAFFGDVVKECDKGDNNYIITLNDGSTITTTPDELIKREEKNHDITIHLGNKVFIIENKIKSLPDMDQLERYLYDVILSLYDKYGRSKVATDSRLADMTSLARCLSDKRQKEVLNRLRKKSKNFAKAMKTKLSGEKNHGGSDKQIGLLTGLPKENKMIQGSCWGYFSYSQIGKRISENLDTSDAIKACDFKKKLVSQYCDDIICLSEAIDKAIKASVENYTFECAELFRKIRFDDVFKKLKLSQLAEKIDEMSDKGGFKFRKYIDFSGADASLNIKYEYKEDNRYAIGIQIQGYSFRYFVTIPELAKTDENKNAVFEELVEMNWFAAKGQKLHGHDLASRGNPCNKFAPDMIYQHYLIKEGTPYDELIKQISDAFKKESFKQAFEYIKNCAIGKQ